MESEKFKFGFLVLIGILQIVFGLTSCNQYEYINQTLEIAEQGIWITKNDTTNRIIIVNYYQGKKHGKYLEYHSNGRISILGYYKKGIRHRTWKTYLEDGTLSSVIKYQNGQGTRTRIYNHSW